MDKRHSTDKSTDKEPMSVNEAGRRGGEATAETHGHEFYEKIGHMGGEKGGQRERELVEKGHEAEENRSSSRTRD
jgi:general stress protein YciG